VLSHHEPPENANTTELQTHCFPDGGRLIPCASTFIPEAIWLKVQYNLVTFLEDRINLYDIPVAYPDIVIPKPYHVFVRIAALGFGRTAKLPRVSTATLTSFQAHTDNRVRGRRESQP
jgi:hypothetical protein